MLHDDSKSKTTYTKDMLVKKIAKEHDIDQKVVLTVYRALEDNVFNVLSLADLNTDVSVRLFEGITIDSSFLPERKKMNNLTGETMTASSKIKAKANVTRNYCEKLTDHNK